MALFVTPSNLFSTTQNGLVPLTTTSNTTDFLRRDGTWAAAGGSTTIGSSTTFEAGYDPSEKETPAGAQTKVNILSNTLGTLAFESAVELTDLGTTLVEGGYIKAGVVVAGNITSGILQSADGSSWLNLNDGTFNFGDGKLSFIAGVFAIHAATAEIDVAGTTLAEALNNKADQTAIDEIYQYMTFDVSTGLSLGPNASPLRIGVSNTQISFSEGGTNIAYVSGQKMYVVDAKITNAIEVGNHKIRKYDSTITIIEFIG
jgi:hypothetical protein